MHRLVLIALFISGFASFATAQDTQPKVSFFAGYSYNRLPESFDQGGTNLNGFDTQVTGHINKYFGIKGDFSGHFGTQDLAPSICITGPCLSLRSRTQLYNVLAGPELRAPNKSSVTPFAHALAGVAHLRSRLTSSAGFPPSTGSSTNFALGLGGGLDVRINDHLDFRVIQVDYNPIFDDNSHVNAVRVSVGLVFK